MVLSLIWAAGSLKSEFSFLFIGQKSITFRHSCTHQWLMLDVLGGRLPSGLLGVSGVTGISFPNSCILCRV